MDYFSDKAEYKHYVTECCDRCAKCGAKPGYHYSRFNGHAVVCRNPNCRQYVEEPKLWLAVERWNKTQRSVKK